MRSSLASITRYIVLFLGTLSNGLTLAGISAFWQGVVTGIALILAVLFDRFRPDPSR